VVARAKKSLTVILAGAGAAVLGVAAGLQAVINSVAVSRIKKNVKRIFIVILCKVDVLANIGTVLAQTSQTYLPGWSERASN
jgi:hypothetical protein